MSREYHERAGRSGPARSPSRDRDGRSRRDDRRRSRSRDRGHGSHHGYGGGGSRGGGAERRDRSRSRDRARSSRDRSRDRPRRSSRSRSRDRADRAREGADGRDNRDRRSGSRVPSSSRARSPARGDSRPRSERDSSGREAAAASGPPQRAPDGSRADEFPELATLPPEEREHARRMMEIARKAEQRAAARASEDAPARAPVETPDEDATAASATPAAPVAGAVAGASKTPSTVTFLSKEQRRALAARAEEERRTEAERKRREAEDKRREYLASLREEARRAEEDERRRAREAREQAMQQQMQQQQQMRGGGPRGERGGGGGGGGGGAARGSGSGATAPPAGAASAGTVGGSEDGKEQEMEEIKRSYLGARRNSKRVVKPSEKFTRIFKFEWEEHEDTSVDHNPLYKNRAQPALLFGRGYRAGIDMKEQRQSSNYMLALQVKRQQLEELIAQGKVAGEDMRAREEERAQVMLRIQEAERSAREEERAAAAGGGGGGGGGDGADQRHWSEKRLTEMSDRDWRIFREDFDIRVKGGRAPFPLRSWSEAELDAGLMRAIDEQGYARPTPIQMQAIPVGLARRDIIGVAETGSGKTAAFLIPMLEYIRALPRKYRENVGIDGPLALILAPTRELALQIEEEAAKLGKYTDARVVNMVGGHSIAEQGAQVRRGVDIVIGTPGRMMAALESTHLVLNQCNYIVLDEADRMIDMGFEHSVSTIMQHMGSSLKSEREDEAEQQSKAASLGDVLFRTTVMFSATMGGPVEKLAREFLRHPVVVSIGDEESSRNKRISQTVMMCKETQKLKLIVEVMSKATPPVIVFVNIKRNCDMVARRLEENGFAVTVLHGGKSQEQREAALTQFKAGEFDILVATDVAGRGLDIPDVQHVINYDMASAIDRYTHRIGRTGRAGKTGAATTFITEDDKETFYDLKRYLESTGQPVPPELAKHPATSTKPGDIMLSRKDAKVLMS